MSNFKTVKTLLTQLANATSSANLQALLSAVVYHAVVHNNLPIIQLNNIRSSHAPGPFKQALSKYLPMEWVKESNTYKFCNATAIALRTELGLTFQESTLEQVTEALPDIFKKPEKVEPTVETINANFKATNFKSKIERVDKLNTESLAAEMEAVAKYLNALKAKQQQNIALAVGTQETEEQAA